MPTVKEGVINYLLDKAIGKVFPGKAPQKTSAPYVVVIQDGSEGRYHAGGSDGLREAQLTIECYGKTEFEAATVSEQVRLALDGPPKGRLGQLEHRGVFVDDIRDISVPAVSGDENGFPGSELLVTVWHQVEKGF